MQLTPLPLFSWLYDVKQGPEGLRFTILGGTVHLLKFDNMKSVTEVGAFDRGTLTAYNFKNRLFARAFLIELRRGWFTGKVLVTPKGPDAFLDWLKENGVDVK